MSAGGHVGDVYVNVHPEDTRDVLERLLFKATDLRDTSLGDSRRDVAELFRRWLLKELDQLRGYEAVTTSDYGEPSSSGAATEPEGTGTPAAPLGEP